MIKESMRLSRVRRVFDPYQDRRNFVRLDRNEDPVGWDEGHFKEFIGSLTPYDLAAYSDSGEFLGKLANWTGHPVERLYVTAGSDQAIKTIFETYVDPGDRVLFMKPSWRMYDVYGDVYAAECDFVEFDQSMQVDNEKILEAAGSGRYRMILLANPNQPTGTVLSAALLREAIQRAARKSSIVVLDEAYYGFCEETSSQLVPEFANLIVVRTFSKAFGLASLRLGYVIASPDRIRELMLLRPVTDANALALKAGEYALDNWEWVRGRIADHNSGRDWLHNAIRQAGLITYLSFGNFLLVRYASLDQGRRVVTDVREEGYLLKGPFDFSPLVNCIRITTGPLELMRRFWADCRDIMVSAGR